MSLFLFIFPKIHNGNCVKNPLTALRICSPWTPLFGRSVPTSFLLFEPMDQGAISTFKDYNMRRTFAKAVVATQENTQRILMELRKDYNINDCLRNLAKALGDIAK